MSFDLAILTNGAEGLDKFYAALDEADKKNRFAAPLFGQAVALSPPRFSVSGAYVHAQIAEGSRGKG